MRVLPHPFFPCDTVTWTESNQVTWRQPRINQLVLVCKLLILYGSLRLVVNRLYLVVWQLAVCVLDATHLCLLECIPDTHSRHRHAWLSSSLQLSENDRDGHNHLIAFLVTYLWHQHSIFIPAVYFYTKSFSFILDCGSFWALVFCVSQSFVLVNLTHVFGQKHTLLLASFPVSHSLFSSYVEWRQVDVWRRGLSRSAYTSTAVHQKCHASKRPPDVILCRSFTRPSTTALAVIEDLGTRLHWWCVHSCLVLRQTRPDYKCWKQSRSLEQY